MNFDFSQTFQTHSYCSTKKVNNRIFVMAVNFVKHIVKFHSTKVPEICESTQLILSSKI